MMPLTCVRCHSIVYFTHDSDVEARMCAERMGWEFRSTDDRDEKLTRAAQEHFSLRDPGLITQVACCQDCRHQCMDR